jgi:hypothetical protein
MCGIITHPTREHSFGRDMFPRLSPAGYADILGPFVELGLPIEASLLTLHLADMWKRDEHLDRGYGITVPFAFYEKGVRIVSPTSARLEKGAIHLAMAGETLLRVNGALKQQVGANILMGHCCEITMGDGSETMLMASAGRNIFRSDALRGGIFERTIPDFDFASRMNPSAGAAFMLTADYLNMCEALLAA